MMMLLSSQVLLTGAFLSFSFFPSLPPSLPPFLAFRRSVASWSSKTSPPRKRANASCVERVRGKEGGK